MMYLFLETKLSQTVNDVQLTVEREEKEKF